MIDNKNPNGLTRANRSLDALNFFLADVRGGLGPYLAVYLLTVQNWNEAEIGIVMSISAIAGILTETPSGALIDAIHAENLSERLADRGGGHVGDEEADGLRLRSRNGNKKSNTPIRLTPRGLIG